MFDAVIFDMDGLMVDTEKVWEHSKKVTCERLGIPFSHEFDSLTRGTSGATFVRCVEEHFASIGYPDVDGPGIRGGRRGQEARPRRDPRVA